MGKITAFSPGSSSPNYSSPATLPALPANCYDDPVPDGHVNAMLSVDNSREHQSGQSVQNEADPRKRAIRLALCGKYSWVSPGKQATTGKAVPVFCNLWECPSCARRMRKQLLKRVETVDWGLVIKAPLDDKAAFNAGRNLRRDGKPHDYLYIESGDQMHIWTTAEAAPGWAEEAVKRGWGASVISRADLPEVAAYMEETLAAEGARPERARRIKMSRGLIPPAEKARQSRPRRLAPELEPVIVDATLEELAQVIRSQGGKVVWVTREELKWEDWDVQAWLDRRAPRLPFAERQEMLSG